jgi:hypothetical protein
MVAMAVVVPASRTLAALRPPHAYPEPANDNVDSMGDLEP